MRALARANQVRLARAELKRRVAPAIPRNQLVMAVEGEISAAFGQPATSSVSIEWRNGLAIVWSGTSRMPEELRISPGWLAMRSRRYASCRACTFASANTSVGPETSKS
jgi:hypothetical protein